MNTYHYDIKMRNEKNAWQLDIKSEDRISAGIQIWTKIQNEGRYQDVEHVFITNVKELN